MAPTDAALAAALERFTFVSMDAYNAAEQMARAGTNQRKSASPSGLGLTGGLDNKLLIVDEAHNFFRAIINGGEDSNARRNYDLIMGARNLRILFLTGTPASKDPFELVPCFNMLAGFNLLPTQYETFYDLYVDKGANTVKNREHFANRIIGLVSHVSTALPTAPAAVMATDAQTVTRAARTDGWFPAELPTIIERVEMGPDQYRRYLLAREKENAEGGGGGGAGGLGTVLSSGPLSLPGAEKKAMRSYFVHSRSLENFTPPRDHADAPVDSIPLAELTDSLAPKLALIARRATAAPGPVLAYSQFVDRGGIRPLTRYLRRAGFLALDEPTIGGALPAEVDALPAEVDALPAEVDALPAEVDAPPAGASAPPASPYRENLDAARKLLSATGAFAHAYTEDERRRILELVAAEQPRPSPWYDPAAPVLPYRKDRELGAANLFNLHHGQRKLFVGELQALTHLLATARGGVTVVYAGAAPGHHMPYLAQLFPTVVWHLYDPAPFKMRGSPAELARIHTHRQYFTDETAREWRDRCDIFISDIRLNPPNDLPDSEQLERTGWSPSFEKQVALDMAMQDGWTVSIRPRLGASLKWRPPYVLAGTPHMIDSLRGRVLIQVWPSRSSTEGRLIVSGADAAANTRMQFDAAHYQDASATRNVVDRPWGAYAALELDASLVPGFDHCYDCAREAAGWRAYMELPVALKASKSAHRTLASLMNALTTATGQRLDGGSRMSTADIVRTAKESRDSRGTRLHGFRPELLAAVRLALAMGSRPGRLGGSPDGDQPRHSDTAPPRYAVITGEVPSEERSRIVAVFNSPENSHGELIKAILVSKTGAEGLDLKWIRETHQIEPYWDRARDDQVRARAVRLGSHDGLPPAEREVQPYLYVATANESIWKHMPSGSREPSTIDEQFYERATRRYQLNQAFRDVLTEACLECDLFGYSQSADGRQIVCRRCVPTNAALWLPDPAADARMPDSCELQTEQTIEAAPLVIDGQTIYYTADPDSSFGYSFFEERADLGAYAPVDPADPRLPKLLQLVLAV